MILTIKDVHQYYNLVTAGKAAGLRLAGCEGTSMETLLLPKLDDNDMVFFLDMTTGTKCYPGQNVIDSIHKTLDTA